MGAAGSGHSAARWLLAAPNRPNTFSQPAPSRPSVDSFRLVLPIRLVFMSSVRLLQILSGSFPEGLDYQLLSDYSDSSLISLMQLFTVLAFWTTSHCSISCQPVVCSLLVSPRLCAHCAYVPFTPPGLDCS